MNILKIAARVSQLIDLSKLRSLAIVLVAGVLMLVTTACNQPDMTASQPPVPDTTEAAVDRAQDNLSDQAIDEDVLSQQGESRARQSDGAATTE